MRCGHACLTLLHSPPFDAANQAELTRKIKLGHVPQLPKGYSEELGDLIRELLSLSVSVALASFSVRPLTASL
jgi:hypothetical protein